MRGDVSAGVRGRRDPRRDDPRLPATCPGCGEADSDLIEYDQRLLTWFCIVCGRSWRSVEDEEG